MITFGVIDVSYIGKRNRHVSAGKEFSSFQICKLIISFSVSIH